jgi:hypothetical protein
MICDTEDNWMCGSAPTNPDRTTTVTGDVYNFYASYLLAYNVSLSPAASGVEQPNIMADSNMMVTFDYNWRVKCPNTGGTGGGGHFPGGGQQQNDDCKAQIVAYLVGNGQSQYLGCAVAETVRDSQNNNAKHATFGFPGPTSSGIYDLRLALSTKSECQEGNAPNSGTIAKICKQ